MTYLEVQDKILRSLATMVILETNDLRTWRVPTWGFNVVDQDSVVECDGQETVSKGKHGVDVSAVSYILPHLQEVMRQTKSE
jgi:hypothetical protein